jgi:hypothetical protein
MRRVQHKKVEMATSGQVKLGFNDEYSGMDFDSAENLLHRVMLCLYGSRFCLT